MEEQPRWAALADDFDVAPQNALGMPGAKRFHRRFLRRETAGQMDGGDSPACTVGNFSVGEDPMEKTVPVSRECRGDARDVRCVQTKADDV